MKFFYLVFSLALFFSSCKPDKVNSKIKVVGITYKDGKPLLSKMPAVTGKQPFTLTGFKEFSLNELEKQLNN